MDKHWINPLTFYFAEKFRNSHWLMQCKGAYHGKSNWLSQKIKSKLKSTNSKKCQMRVSFDHWNLLLTKTEENSLWKFDRLWTKRWKDVVLFSRNSFQMRKNEKAWWKASVLLREIELEKLSVLTRCTWCADDCVRGSDQSLTWFCWIAKKRTGRVFTFWFYLFIRRQKRVMLYKTPLLTVQCAAKGLLRDVSLLLSAVYSFHGHGKFPWRRNCFRKQCNVYFSL